MNEITNRRETSKLRFHGYSYPASSNNKLLLLSNRYVAPSRFLDSKLDAISECLAIINPSLSLSRFKSVEKPCNGGGHLVNNFTSRLLLSYRPSLCRSFSVRYLTRGEKAPRVWESRLRLEGLEAAVPRSLDWLTLPIVPKILQRPSFESDKSNNLSEKVRGRIYRSLGMKLKEMGRELVQRAHTNGGKIGFAMTAEAM